jgi:hypothetical protein
MQNVTGSETLALSAGTFNTSNLAMTIGILSASGSTTRTLTLGSSAITLNRNGTALQYVATGLTVTANTAVFTSPNAPTINLGGVNSNGSSIILTGSSSPTFAGGNSTFLNVTRTGTAVKSDGLVISGGNLTCTGTFTCNGNSTVNRMLVSTDAAGTSRTITAATVSVSNIDLMDIAGAGAGNWNISACTGLSGDCGGNSGMTLTTPATQNYDGVAGNWSTAARWTSRVPLPQDDVTFATSSNAVSIDMPRCGKNVNFANYTGTLTWPTTTNQTFYGSLTLTTGMTNSFGNTVDITFRGRGSHTFDSAGKNFTGTNLTTTVTAPTGTYTLTSAYTTGGTLNLLAGTLDFGNYTVTTSSFNTSGAITRVLNLGSSIVNLTVGSNTCWSWAGTNVTLNAGTSNIVISTVGTAARTFAAGTGVAYNNLTYTVAGSTAILPITGSPTFNTIALAPGRPISLNATTQTNIRNITGAGANWGYQRFTSQPINYVSIPDSPATSWAGDFDLRVKLSADAWNQSNMNIAGKRSSSVISTAWQFNFNASTKQPQLGVSSSGTAFTTGTSTAAVPFADGATDSWLRATWRASDGRIQFFTSSNATNDPSVPTWTQLGTDRTAAVGSIFNSTAPITLGTLDASSGPVLNGNMYRFQARNNILDNGTGIQLDVDFTSKTFGANTFTESSSNAATVSIVGDSAQAGDGRILLRSSSSGTQCFPQFYGLPLSLDRWTFQDVASIVPRKVFATNSVSISNNRNINLTAAPTEPYIAWQANIQGSGASTVLPLPFTPVAGDLLVVGFGNSTNGTGTITPPAGFVLDKGTSATTAMRVYSKIATGSETSLTFTTTLAPAITSLQAYCIRGTGTPSLDATDSNTGITVTTLSSGAGATNTATPAFALSFWQGVGTMNASVSATNNFEWIRPVTELTTARTLVKPLSAIGSNSTTYVWTTAQTVDTETVIYKFVSAPSSNGSFFPFFN